ncbi:hypothetical protein C8J38_11323 [Rhizobium sp. PP-WC-2G-219]|nr:hypothetical protein C8J37_11517 [Rhizobium sp. PP-WC-1G-195]PYE39539.1 hypothetical protein DFI02_1233 [Rhizobium sp. PP-F2F-G20b]TCL89408.1 hypothetical protein C8J38_11323 [Rhizobium sp. PP-WC-2G-219]TCP77796.1 hypothetical protein C8J31_12321 [Rhizobium sp. PP-CC-2G-626]TCQ00594.1 hypothetical protein C8J34_1326 [Rhizobium sp. PP-F2F-G36]TCQ17209.1 hypothetical protein C8J33_1136 [Rhizobium sp. PP-CC-3G-465]
MQVSTGANIVIFVILARFVLELGEVLSLNAMEEADDIYRNIEFDADIEALDSQMSEMVKFAEIAA